MATTKPNIDTRVRSVETTVHSLADNALSKDGSVIVNGSLGYSSSAVTGASSVYTLSVGSTTNSSSFYSLSLSSDSTIRISDARSSSEVSGDTTAYVIVARIACTASVTITWQTYAASSSTTGSINWVDGETPSIDSGTYCYVTFVVYRDTSGTLKCDGIVSATGFTA